MRLQSEKKVTVRNKVLGGPTPYICLPLVAKDRSALLQQTAELVRLNPDWIEWRIDGYDQVTDIGACLAALQALKAAMESIPLIFTCRIHQEGGFIKISQETRLELITTAVASGGVEIVDVETCNEPAFIDKVKKTTQTGNAKLIPSYHNFNETPDETFIYDKLVMAQDLGADIVKLAVMPKDSDYVYSSAL